MATASTPPPGDRGSTTALRPPGRARESSSGHASSSRQSLPVPTKYIRAVAPAPARRMQPVDAARCKLSGDLRKQAGDAGRALAARGFRCDGRRLVGDLERFVAEALEGERAHL